jgi:hypothetical protein
VLDRIDQARADGLAITGHVGTRAVGLLFSLQRTMHPSMANPVFAELADRPLPEQARIMGDPAFKSRLLDAAANGKVGMLGGAQVKAFRLMFELADPPDYGAGSVDER